MQARNRLHNQWYRGLFRAQKLLVNRDYLIIRVTSRATPSSCDAGQGEAQFPHGTCIHCEAPPPPCVESAVHAEFAETPLP